MVAPPERRHLTVTALSVREVATLVMLGGVESYFIANAVDPWFPAWSVQAPLIAPPAVSGPAYFTGAVHESIPDVASVPENVIETGWLYQPVFVGCRFGAAVTAGGVASYLTANDAEPLTLPALSRQVPVAAPAAESGPEYVVDVHDARPDVLSVPWNDRLTVCVYQPFLSGARSADAPVTVGAEVSMLNCR